MFCKKCGHKHLVNSKYCSECGNKFNSNKNKRILYIFIVLTGIILLASLAYNFIQKTSTSSNGVASKAIVTTIVETTLTSQTAEGTSATQVQQVVPGGISDNDIVPAGTTFVFSGIIAETTTYKEFRQTQAYQTIATNYVGYGASNAEIKAVLEWLIERGRAGAQTLPTRAEYESEFLR